MSKKLTTQEIQARLIEGVTLKESTFKGIHKKATFIDSEYGEWTTTPFSVLYGKRRHPKYKSDKVKQDSRHSVDHIIKQLPQHLSLDISTYVNTHTKARFIDSEYGEWWATYNTIQNKKANHPLRGKSNRIKTTTLAIDTIKSRLPDYIQLVESSYVNTHTKAKFIDEKYGEWEAMPYSILAGGKHPLRQGVSYLEQKLLDTLKFDTRINIEFWNRRCGVYNYKPDFKIKSNNKLIYIDVDGLIWHSTHPKYGKSPNYHLNKRVAFERQNQTLLQFRQNEIESKIDIVSSIIKAKLGVFDNKIYARKTEIRLVDNKEANIFLNENHLMGQFKTAKHVGLFYNDTLVSLLSYKKFKTGIDISRFCCKLNTTVIGGLSKLINYVSKHNNASFIQSFVDLRYGTGSSLIKNGFEFSGTTIGWNWTDFDHIYNRLQCRANMDHRKLTQQQHADEMNWFKIYDAGQAKFIKKMVDVE